MMSPLLWPSVVAGQERPLFSAESELVVLHVTVRDGRGAYVTGLPQESFRILEDDIPQKLQFFEDEDTPATIGLLIDSSASMRSNRDLVIAATAAFAGASNPGDDLFALTFNDVVRAALPVSGPFTSDGAVLRDALAKTLNARGRTALFDGIAAGLDYFARGRHERRVLVVVSDGGDNASRSTFDEVLTRAQRANAIVYTVALVDRTDRDANPAVLRRLAEASGGEAFRPDSASEIVRVLQRVARDIRHTYTLGYASSNTTRDGVFRHIRVAIDSPDRRLNVRTRRGYPAGSPNREGVVGH
jgi:VWFA-related protein